MEDELVQYFIVNSELNMSTGKVAAQVAHVATNISHAIYQDMRVVFPATHKWSKWLVNSQPKIILRGKQKEMEKLIEQGWYFIRDNGRTEIEPNSLTCVAWFPEHKSIMKSIVKRFQLL